MRVAVTNNSKAPQGVSTLDGTRWIKPGAKLTISVEDTKQLERLPFLAIEYSDAGVPVGDLPAPPKSLLDKAKPAKRLTGDEELDEELDAALDARPAATMALKKDELLAIAKQEGVKVETDDNKADLVRKINAARK
jgi:hypothetical protein